MKTLIRAIKSKKVDKVRAAVEGGDDVNGRDAKQDTPLHVAASAADGPTVAALLALGGDREATDKNGMTPLYKCIAFQNVDGARVLIEAGADIERGPPKGWTPLQKSAYDGLESVVDALLAAGANANRIEKEMSPLAMACWGYKRDPARYDRIIQRLRAGGAEVDSTAQEWAKTNGVSL